MRRRASTPARSRCRSARVLTSRPPPTILATRMLSTLKLLGFLGQTSTQAWATRGHNTSSKPYCLDATAPCKRKGRKGSSTWGPRPQPPTLRASCIVGCTRRTLMRLMMSLLLRGSNLSLPGMTSESRISRAASAAFRYPSAISDGWRPSRMSPSAWPSSSPASVTTRLVPSPISCCWAEAAMTTSLAAGWATSSSFTMVAVSLVTNSFSKWLITILFMPATRRHDCSDPGPHCCRHWTRIDGAYR